MEDSLITCQYGLFQKVFLVQRDAEHPKDAGETNMIGRKNTWQALGCNFWRIVQIARDGSVSRQVILRANCRGVRLDVVEHSNCFVEMIDHVDERRIQTTRAAESRKRHCEKAAQVF